MSNPDPGLGQVAAPSVVTSTERDHDRAKDKAQVVERDMNTIMSWGQATTVKGVEGGITDDAVVDSGGRDKENINLEKEVEGLKIAQGKEEGLGPPGAKEKETEGQKDLAESGSERKPDQDEEVDGGVELIDQDKEHHADHHREDHARLPRSFYRARSKGRPHVKPNAAGSPASSSTRAEEAGATSPPAPTLKQQPKASTFLEQVAEWLHHERHRRRQWKANRDSKRLQKQQQKKRDGEGYKASPLSTKTEIGDEHLERPHRSPSPASSTSTFTEHLGASTESLDNLERIIARSLGPGSSLESLMRSGRPTLGRQKSSSRKIKPPKTHAKASDTEPGSDGDVVPGCEVYLKNPEEIGWDQFKSEVLRLAHTLRCKGWRRIPLDDYKEIQISRISGALTNAVYMVSPPSELPLPPKKTSTNSSSVSISSKHSGRNPSKLLLRIYGPQVSHLIDRDVELSILRRLARRKIGPRLLGTFENGRFEQFFNARTLTRDDIRVSEISKQIARRMRELHTGIDLEEQERKNGPVVWMNWDKWLKRTREVMRKVDAEAEKSGKYLCGLPWEKFEEAVAKYRAWQLKEHGGEDKVRERLVFAHNDTQYGNILRLQPSEESPLLLPVNEHKQLVVIDFEYASANVPGFEFANHFCEWMANYHDAKNPYVLREADYPTLDEQKNFLRAYVEHHRSNSGSRTNSTPRPQLMISSSYSFSLDARTPGNQYKEEEAARQKATEKEIEQLLYETNIWRPASSAMWCAWGIVQAKDKDKEKSPNTESGEEEEPAAEEEDDEFNYFGYAQQRALLFLGDLLTLGVMSEEELGPAVVQKVKRAEMWGHPERELELASVP